MARRPSFKIVKTPNGWRVNVPASVSESGERERHFHKTRDEAKAHASRLRERYQKHGEAAAVILPRMVQKLSRRLESPW